MKIRELTEAVFANAQVLKDLAALILNQWPDTIPDNSMFVIGQPRIQDDPRIAGTHPIEGIDQLIEKYEDYPQLVQGLTQFRTTGLVLLINTQKGLETDAMGSYHYGKKFVKLNIAQMQGRTDAFDVELLKYFRKTIIETLVHELRHYFQDVDFGPYIQSDRSRKGEWSERSMEWDAEWNAVLTNYDPNQWSNPSDFADAVIDHWVREINNRSATGYRLSDQVINQHRKKAIKYFFQNNDFFIRSAFKKAVQRNMSLINNRSFVSTALNTFKSLTSDTLSSVAYNQIRSQLFDYWKMLNTNNAQRNAK